MNYRIAHLLLAMALPLWADPSDSAKMTVMSHGFTIFEYDVPLKPLSKVDDPLLCQRVDHHLAAQARIARQRQALADKMARDPSHVTNQDLDEMANLELRAQESYDFLAQPAPTLMAIWPLDELNDPILERLSSASLPFQLHSHSVIWQGAGDSFAMPPGTGHILVSKTEGTLKLILESSLVNYCWRQPTILAFDLE